ncbi:hypothetical protein [Marivivens marinus]|uniref:hypothetical protein n=1 Tax=Marivivens marinus TaxID=3110173 RepID=UPI003B849C2C
MTARKMLSAALCATLSLTALSTVTLFTTADTAFAAGRGNGNGNGNSNRGRDRDRTNRGSEQRGNSQNTGRPENPGANGNGAIARELRNLNAMCANENAMANASANSNVGRISTFYVAKAEADTARDALSPELSALSDEELADQVAVIDATITQNTGAITDLQGQLAGLDPTTQQTEIDAINGQISTLQQANLSLEADKTAIDQYLVLADAKSVALNDATGGRELSPEALAVFEAGCQK